MNDICLILPCNLYVVPYFKIYEQIFIDLNIRFDIITWNRSLIKEKCFGNVISYDVYDKANDRNPFKVFKFLGFARFCRTQIMRNKYKKLIFLDTSSCCLFLLTNFLKKRFFKQYWVDVRDYTFENIGFYKKTIKKALENAYSFDVSSRGFFRFLPHFDKYYVTHNIDLNTIEAVKLMDKIPSDKIRISFIGNVRYFEQNVSLLNLLKNDNRFLLQFFGIGSEKLQEYCNSNTITNVKFTGRFSQEKTPRFYCETDLINNIYGFGNMEVDTALSNKLYYSLYLNIPILVSPNTYLCELVTKYDLGYVVDLNNKNLANELFDWYKAFIKKPNPQKQQLINDIQYEYNSYIKGLKSFIEL